MFMNLLLEIHIIYIINGLYSVRLLNGKINVRVHYNFASL